MRCTVNHSSRPILVSAIHPRTAHGIASIVVRSRPTILDRTPNQSIFQYPLTTPELHHRIQTHRITTVASIRRYSASATTTRTTIPKSENEDNHSALNPLPLPRRINPSKGLFLIHLPIPPSHWPSHLDIFFPLLRRTAKWMKSRGIVVNCIYDGVGTETEFREEKEGGYVARLFNPAGSHQWENFGEDILRSEGFKGDVDGLMAQSTVSSVNPRLPVEGMEKENEILVCTHGSRDCRCADLGGSLVESLLMEISKRELSVKVREIAHVGGHKYAANAIILPSMDMYSNLLPSDTGKMLDHLTFPRSNEPTSLHQHWRGRYGCTESEQEDLWKSINPSHPSTTLPFNSNARESGAIPQESKEVVELRFKTYEGESRMVKAKVGDTLLQVARENDLPSMEGSCGGNLECSTCHLYVPPTCPIPEPTDSELDMLGYALGYKDDESRLGCQVQVGKEMGEWCEKGGEFGLPRY